MSALSLVLFLMKKLSDMIVFILRLLLLSPQEEHPRILTLRLEELHFHQRLGHLSYRAVARVA